MSLMSLTKFNRNHERSITTMKVFITKRVFTEGIVEVDSAIESSVNRGMIIVSPRGSLSFETYFHGQGREWHRDRVSAIRRAKELQAAKIKALEKQLQKIKNIEFV